MEPNPHSRTLRWKQLNELDATSNKIKTLNPEP
jgi:hypothetical protein